ncbi:MAG: GNAT family N-acetyltransferase, partial [Monoglobus pectinilyticus]
MQQYNIIKTKRLILRKFNKDDTKALFTLLSDNEVNTFLPMFPLNSIDEAEEYLNNIINSKDLT